MKEGMFYDMKAVYYTVEEAEAGIIESDGERFTKDGALIIVEDPNWDPIKELVRVVIADQKLNGRREWDPEDTLPALMLESAGLRRDQVNDILKKRGFR